jgi:hypothetical protein
MNPEGIIAIAHQPRHSGAKREDTLAAGELIAHAMVSSGIAIVTTEILEIRAIEAPHSVHDIRHYFTVTYLNGIGAY